MTGLPINVALIALVAIPMVLVGFVHWKSVTKVLWIWIVLEGAARKWLMPGQQDVIYFVKDFFILGIYLRIAMQTMRGKFNSYLPPTFFILFGILTTWCILDALNPSHPHPIVSLMGLRGYVFYVPMILVIPAVFDNAKAFFDFLKKSLWILWPCCILGIIQFFSPPGSLITRQVGWTPEQADYITMFYSGNHVRICGPFSYITGYSAYLVLMFLLVTGFMISTQGWKGRLHTYVLMGLIVVNLLMSGSRGAVLFAIIALMAYLVVGGVLSSTHFLRLLLQMIMIVGISYLVLGILFPEATRVFSYRVTANHDIPDRVESMFTDLGHVTAVAGLTGYGTGATHQSSQLLAPSAVHSDMPTNEDELARVIIELGITGFIIVFVFRFYVLFSSWVCMHATTSLEAKFLMLAFVLFQVYSLWVSMTFDHTHLFLFWYFSGLFPMARREIAQSKQQAPINHAWGQPVLRPL